MPKILTIPDESPREYTNMPFGRWKGYPLSDVPNSYLEWCLDECNIVAENTNLYESIKTRLMLGIPVKDYEP